MLGFSSQLRNLSQRGLKFSSTFKTIFPQTPQTKLLGSRTLTQVRNVQSSNDTAWLALGGMSVAGLFYLMFKGNTATVPATNSSLFYESTDRFFTDSVRARLSNTYLYFASGLATTAGAAYYAHSTGLVYRISPMALGIGSFIISIGTMMATQMIPYENTVPKHLALGAFQLSMGMGLAPIFLHSGPVVMQAAVATACVVGSMSLVAASAPSEQFLWMGGPLSIGLGLVVGASLGRIFFPQSSILYNVCTYGGVGLFSLFMLYDTQKILYRANNSAVYDPINNSIGIYMNSINIFVRMLNIVQGNKKR